MAKKTLQPQPRSARYNRFQTSVPGFTYVHTVADAHFDPYAETARPLHISRAEMEAIPRVPVVPATGTAARR